MGHRLTPEEKVNRFWSKVKKSSDPNGCWEWTASRLVAGYGQFLKMLSHRFSYELYFGPIPKGELVLHHCDNPSCVNPEHLFLGSQKDNLYDARIKGRLIRSAEFKEEASKIRKGIAFSEEHKRKLSVSMQGRGKGVKQSEEFIRKRTKNLKGKTYPTPSEETRKKISIALKGRVFSLEWREKLRVSTLRQWRKKRAQKALIALETIC